MKNILLKNKLKEKGSVLAYALVIMTIVVIILVSMIGYIVSQLKFSYYKAEKEKAFQVAEAGIYYYRWYLAHETSGKTAQQIVNFWNSGTAIGVSDPYTSDYEGIGNFTLDVTPPAPGSTIITVTSEGYTNKMPDVKRKVRVRFRRPSWSEYMWVINDFVNFGEQAEVYGRIHSNFGIRFDGLAHNVVSSLPAKFNDPSHGGCNEFGVHTHNPIDPCAPASDPPWPEGTIPDKSGVFEAGRQFPVSEVSFNGIISDLGAMKTEAQKPGGSNINNCTATGCYFDYDTEEDYGRRIILKSDGNFDICTVEDYQHTALHPRGYRENTGTGTCDTCGGGNSCTTTYTIPDNGIIFVEGRTWVDGSINNKNITIAAANLLGGAPADILIGTGNIRYASYNCDNIIGLVAQENISVIRDCPDNFVVDAALLAQSGRISRGNYAINKSSLTFNGALASYLQPYFNTGNNGFGVRTYNFDNNLLYCPPPFFPTGTEYAIDLWEEL